MTEPTKKKKNSFAKYFLMDHFEDVCYTRKILDWDLELFILILTSGVIFFAILYFFYAKNQFATHPGEITCKLRLWFGLYCPGCGSTHALVAFLSGNLKESFSMSPMIPIYFVSCLIYTIVNGLCYFTKGKIKGIRLHLWYFFVYAALPFLQCIYVNYMFLVKGIALIP